MEENIGENRYDIGFGSNFLDVMLLLILHDAFHPWLMTMAWQWQPSDIMITKRQLDISKQILCVGGDTLWKYLWIKLFTIWNLSQNNLWQRGRKGEYEWNEDWPLVTNRYIGAQHIFFYLWNVYNFPFSMKKMMDIFEDLYFQHYCSIWGPETTQIRNI